MVKRVLKKGKTLSSNQSNDEKFKSSDDSNVHPDHEQPTTLQHVLNELENCDDLMHKAYPEIETDIIYFSNLLDFNSLYRNVINPLLNIRNNDLPDLLQQSQFRLTKDPKELINGIVSGQVAVFCRNNTYLVIVSRFESRSVTESETESVITGPHDAFIELADTNLALIRQRIRSSHLKVVKRSVGEITKTDVFILYIKDIVDMNYVDEVMKRIENIETDAVYDTNMLIQYMDDSPYSIFPQFLTSERPDAISSKLTEGRVIGIMDGSPTAFSSPTTFFEFFQSSDDYYQRWLLGSSIRLLRFVALFITLFMTALYVSVTTFHYEMIPVNLLNTLTESRAKVPFPPLLEAVFMEMTIELLREAGARLPSKIGQTIGIVGGIVIGTAAVQAGLTSNILIIAVAMSAIASFVVPIIVMSASIRVLRFGLIILAGLWGNFGIAIGFVAIVIHLSGLTSLGSSYLTPVAPMNWQDWKDTFIVAPYRFFKSRPSQVKSPNPRRNRIRK